MKTSAERGPVGAWAYEARTEADLSPEQVVERLARQGHALTAATIRGIEGGSKRPGRRLLRLLAEIYGRPVPGATEAPPSEMAALVAALSALVDEMRLAREREQDAAAALVQVAEALLSTQRPRVAGEPTEPAVRVGSAR